jgi:hypothetical protein
MTKDILHLARSVKPIRVGLSDGGELKDPTKRAAFMNLFNPKPANLPATVAAPAPAPSTPEENKALAVPSSGPASVESADLIAKATKTLMEAPVSRRKFLETSRNAVAAVNQAGNINKLLKPTETLPQIPEHIPETVKFDKIKFVEDTLKEIFDHFEESAYDFSIPYDHLKGALEGYMKRYPKTASMKNVKNAIDELHDPEEFIKNYFDHMHFTKEELDHLGENDHLNQLLAFHDENILPNYGKYEWNDMKDAAKDAEEKRKAIIKENFPKKESTGGFIHKENGEVEKIGSAKKLSPSEWIKHLAKKSDGGEADSPGISHNSPPMDEHPEHFRELNKLGLYSKAAEVAQDATGQNIKQTPDQWHKYLIGRGVKPDEVKWSHFENAFDPEEKVHKDDVAAHFNYQNQEPYTEQVYKNGGHDYENDESGLMMLAHDMANEPKLFQAVFPKKHLQEHAKRKEANGEDVSEWLLNEWSHDLENYILKQKNSEGHYPTRHSRYQMEGPSENYRELVLQHNPENEKFRAAAHFPDAANPLLHIRMADRKGLNGEKLLHIEELQSDWGQKGAYSGFNEKDKEALYKKWREAEKNHHELDFIFRNKLRKKGKVPESIIDNSSFPDLIFDHGSPEDIDNYRNSQEKIFSALRRAKVPLIHEGPHVGDTNKWTDLGLKRILKEAADGGYHGITFAPGIVQASRWGNTRGLIHPYDVTIPSRMQKLISNHDPSLKFETYSHDLPIWHDPEFNTTSTTKVHYLPMSEKAASSIKEGQERFKRGGFVHPARHIPGVHIVTAEAGEPVFTGRR